MGVQWWICRHRGRKRELENRFQSMNGALFKLLVQDRHDRSSGTTRLRFSVQSLFWDSFLFCNVGVETGIS